MSIPPPGPLAYEGVIAVPYIVRNFPPTSSNNQFNVPTIWANPLDEEAFILLSKPGGVANWSLFTNSGGAITDIETPDGNTAVPSDGTMVFSNGTGTNITSSGNTITFNSIGGGLAWDSVSGTSQSLVKGHAYVPSNGALTTFTLPATAAFGDFYVICGLGAGGWTISQNAGQSIILGKETSKVGVGGSISSSLPSDTIELVCVVANTTFKVVGNSGALAYVGM